MTDPTILTPPPDPEPETPPVEEPQPGPAQVGPTLQGIPPHLKDPVTGQILPLALAQIVPSAQAWSAQRAEDGSWILMQRVESLNGSFVFGYPVEYARQMGRDIIELADSHQNSGLIVPGGPGIPTDLFDGVEVRRS